MSHQCIASSEDSRQHEKETGDVVGKGAVGSIRFMSGRLKEGVESRE